MGREMELRGVDEGEGSARALREESGLDEAPDPEVAARATRRRFTAEYKVGILRQADACSDPGQLGVLLRREGLYSSHLAKWRQQRAAGCLHGRRHQADEDSKT